MKKQYMKATKVATAVALCAMGMTCVAPAHAETEIEALKRELAEQRELINKLLAAQASQKESIEKIEARPVQPLAQANNSAIALPKGLTVYGTMDVNVANNNSGYGRKTTVGSAGMTATSIGIKGEKGLAEGLRAVGEVEMGVDLSTGVAGNGPNASGINAGVPSGGGFIGNGNQLFSRQAYAGLASDIYGTLVLGRQYSGSYIAAATQGNVFGVGFYGNSTLFLPLIGGMPTRLNNAIVYKSPSFAGFSVYATYTAGNENNVNSTILSGTSRMTDSSGAGWDVALFYRRQALNAALSVWSVKNAAFADQETGLAKKAGWQVAANYDFGLFRLFGNFFSGKISGGNYENVTKTLSKAHGWSLSAGVPYGRHTFMASYARLDDKSLLHQDASAIGIAYTFKLYDATWLYVSYGKMMNKRNSTYSLGNGGDLVGSPSAPGFQPNGVMLGLNFKF